jgi:hypothetical protein
MSHSYAIRAFCAVFVAFSCVACAHGAARERGVAAQPVGPGAALRPTAARLSARARGEAKGPRAVVALSLAEPDDGTLDAKSVALTRSAGERLLSGMGDVVLGSEPIGPLRERAAAMGAYALTLRGAFRALDLDGRAMRFEVRVAIIDAERHNLIATLRGAGSAEGVADGAMRQRAAQAALESALRGLPSLVAALPGLAAQGALATR